MSLHHRRDSAVSTTSLSSDSPTATTPPDGCVSLRVVQAELPKALRGASVRASLALTGSGRVLASGRSGVVQESTSSPSWDATVGNAIQLPYHRKDVTTGKGDHHSARRGVAVTVDVVDGDGKCVGSGSVPASELLMCSKELAVTMCNLEPSGRVILMVGAGVATLPTPKPTGGAAPAVDTSVATTQPPAVDTADDSDDGLAITFANGFLDVTILEGCDLPNMDTLSKQDPFVVLELVDGTGRTLSTGKTGVVKFGGRNPKWTAAIGNVVRLPYAGVQDPDGCQLRIEAWDEDIGTSNDLIGKVTVDADEWVGRALQPQHCEFRLMSGTGTKSCGVLRASVSCECEVVSKPVMGSPPAAAAAATAVTGAAANSSGSGSGSGSGSEAPSTAQTPVATGQDALSPASLVAHLGAAPSRAMSNPSTPRRGRRTTPAATPSTPSTPSAPPSVVHVDLQSATCHADLIESLSDRTTDVVVHVDAINVEGSSLAVFRSPPAAVTSDATIQWGDTGVDAMQLSGEIAHDPSVTLVLSLLDCSAGSVVAQATAALHTHTPRLSSSSDPVPVSWSFFSPQDDAQSGPELAVVHAQLRPPQAPQPPPPAATATAADTTGDNTAAPSFSAVNPSLLSPRPPPVSPAIEDWFKAVGVTVVSGHDLSTSTATPPASLSVSMSLVDRNGTVIVSSSTMSVGGDKANPVWASPSPVRLVAPPASAASMRPPLSVLLEAKHGSEVFAVGTVALHMDATPRAEPRQTVVDLHQQGQGSAACGWLLVQVEFPMIDKPPTALTPASQSKAADGGVLATPPTAATAAASSSSSSSAPASAVHTGPVVASGWIQVRVCAWVPAVSDPAPSTDGVTFVRVMLVTKADDYLHVSQTGVGRVSDDGQSLVWGDGDGADARLPLRALSPQGGQRIVCQVWSSSDSHPIGSTAVSAHEWMTATQSSASAMTLSVWASDMSVDTKLVGRLSVQVTSDVRMTAPPPPPRPLPPHPSPTAPTAGLPSSSSASSPPPPPPPPPPSESGSTGASATTDALPVQASAGASIPHPPPVTPSTHALQALASTSLRSSVQLEALRKSHVTLQQITLLQGVLMKALMEQVHSLDGVVSMSTRSAIAKIEAMKANVDDAADGGSAVTKALLPVPSSTSPADGSQFGPAALSLLELIGQADECPSDVAVPAVFSDGTAAAVASAHEGNAEGLCKEVEVAARARAALKQENSVLHTLVDQLRTEATARQAEMARQIGVLKKRLSASRRGGGGGGRQSPASHTQKTKKPVVATAPASPSATTPPPGASSRSTAIATATATATSPASSHAHQEFSSRHAPSLLPSSAPNRRSLPNRRVVESAYAQHRLRPAGSAPIRKSPLRQPGAATSGRSAGTLTSSPLMSSDSPPAPVVRHPRRRSPKKAPRDPLTTTEKLGAFLLNKRRAPPK